MSFVPEAVSYLVNSECVLEVPFQSLVVNPLTVHVSITRFGKKRLIPNPRLVNKYILKENMRFEDIK